MRQGSPTCACAYEVRTIAREREAIDLEQLAAGPPCPPRPRRAMASSSTGVGPSSAETAPRWLLGTRHRLVGRAEQAHGNQWPLANQLADELMQLREEHTRPAAFGLFSVACSSPE